MAVTFSRQIGFSAAMKGSAVTGLMLAFIFASIFLLYELLLLIIKIVQKKRSSPK